MGFEYSIWFTLWFSVCLLRRERKKTSKITSNARTHRVRVFFPLFLRLWGQRCALANQQRIATVVIRLNWINGDAESNASTHSVVFPFCYTDKSNLTTHFRYELWIRNLFHSFLPRPTNRLSVDSSELNSVKLHLPRLEQKRKRRRREKIIIIST